MARYGVREAGSVRFPTDAFLPGSVPYEKICYFSVFPLLLQFSTVSSSYGT
jgi:hypothetical protein